MKRFKWIDKYREDVATLLRRGHTPGYVSDWLRDKGVTLGALHLMSKQCPEIADLMDRRLWEVK